MRPYYERDGITIYRGDVLDVLDDGVGSFDAVVTDPPYCSGGRQQAGARNTISKAGGRQNDEWLPTDTMGSDSYLWWLRQIGQRLTASAAWGTHCYLFTDWRQYPTVITAMETTGWTLRSCVVWNKMRGGAMGSFWRNDHELIPVFAKGQPRALPDGSFWRRRNCTAAEPSASRSKSATARSPRADCLSRCSGWSRSHPRTSPKRPGHRYPQRCHFNRATPRAEYKRLVYTDATG